MAKTSTQTSSRTKRKKITSKKAASSAVRSTTRTKAPVIAKSSLDSWTGQKTSPNTAKNSQIPTHNSSLPDNSAPYSLTATLQFLNQNFGLLFIVLAIFIVGFIGGSMWSENQAYKYGLLPSPVQPAGATGAGGAVGTGAQPSGNPSNPNAPLSDADWKTIQENPVGIIGNKNAKVAMVEFTDYQCPFCGQFFNTSYATLKKNYLDTGKVKLIVRDQPLPFHPNARIAALAARCASDQGGFLGWDKDKHYEYMHETLFANQNDWVNLSKDDAIKKFGDYATKGGMNSTELQNCVKSEKFGKQVDADSALAAKVGANGTPTFFINKTILVGAQPTTTFTAALDQALKQ